MKPSSLAVLLKISIVVAGVAGLGALFLLMLYAAEISGAGFPEFRYLVLPCQIAVSVAAVPCYASLILFWQMSTRIAKGAAYCRKTARSLGVVGRLAAFDTALCIAVTVCLCIAGAFNAGTLFFALPVVLAGITISALASALARAVGKLAG